MFEVDYKITDFFFDRLAVQDKLAAKELRAMSRIGAFIMRGARQSIERRKAVSAAGSPPSAHSTDKVASLKNILFGYEPSAHSVIVGPVKLNMQTQDWINFGSITVPQLMEFGGVAVIKEERWKGSTKWFRRDLRRKGSENKEYRQRRAIYRPRPFMAPALERERRNYKLIEAWKEIL